MACVNYIVNKYKKNCQSCNIDVEVGKGFAYRNGHKWLTVCSSTACMKRLGLELPKEQGPVVRKLSDDGVVTIPFDRKALPLLRAMPPAKGKKRFNADKTWNVSVEPEHLKRVIEIADKLELEVSDELRAKAEMGTEEYQQAKLRVEKLSQMYDFQKEGVYFLAGHKRALLADDQGLGKTLTTIIALPENPKAICICPASLKYNWAKECKMWRPEIRTTVLEGRESFKMPEENEMVIINYDILPDWLLPKETGKLNVKGKPIKRVDVPDEFKQQMKDVYIIGDEVQFVKKYKTKRAQKFRTLSSLSLGTWMLTGTPLPNKPPDLFGVVSAGNMNVFGTWYKFVELFQGFPNGFGGYEWGDPVPEVTERLRNIMLRRLKKDVWNEMPSKTYKYIDIHLRSKESKELEKLTKELIAEAGFGNSSFEDVAEIINLPSFEEFSEVRARLAEYKIPAALEIVESYEESETPLVVFSAHVKPIKTIGTREGWAYITGETPAKERQRIVDDFQGGKLKGIACTIKAAGAGLTLTRAHDVLFIDLHWNPGENVQAEDRVHRIGQTENVLYMYLCTNNPLDIHVHKLLLRKIQWIKKALESSVEFKKPKEHSNMPELIEETEEELKQRIEAAEKEVEEKEAQGRIHSILGREIAKSPVPEPELTPKRKKLIKNALSYMVARCDHAMTKDGVGFNKPDAAIAHWIFKTGLHDNDEKTYRVTERILSRYSRQLENEFAAIWRPDL